MFLKKSADKNQQYLCQIPKIYQSLHDINFLYTPINFRSFLLSKIKNATYRICIVALYLENDEGGESILQALYKVKRSQPNLDINVLVDWHRAQRACIGTDSTITNADWYYQMNKKNPDVDIPIYGVPINTREALGVLHFKGFIIDNYVIYSGISINNSYLYQHDRYRYDRYHCISNTFLANSMFEWVLRNLIMGRGTDRLNISRNLKKRRIEKVRVKLYRQELINSRYFLTGNANYEELSVTPLLGIGKANLLNKTILHLISSTRNKLIICTPYFNLTPIMLSSIIYLLNKGRKLEIIIGDKTSSDFFIPENQPFKLISILPYLYEINLYHFLIRLQKYVDNYQLTVRVWKHGEHSYHLKGMWIDNNWMLLTSSNFNSRAWCLDLENGILIHDPRSLMSKWREKELNLIRKYTTLIRHYESLQNPRDYPIKVYRLIRYLQHTRIDRIISRIL